MTDIQASQTLADLDIEKLRKEIRDLKPYADFAMDQFLTDVSDRRDDRGINVHVPIRFVGGDEWFLRAPTFGSTPPEPADLIALTRTSEVLTYKALRAAGVAVPEVYSWGFGSVSRSAGEQTGHDRANRFIRPLLLSCAVREAAW
jgi:hypothetical protein